MAITQTPSLVTQLDLPAYALGILILLFVMLVHGLVLLQVAKRYEVKSFLSLAPGLENDGNHHCFFWNVFFCLDCLNHDFNDQELQTGLYPDAYEETQYSRRNH